MKKSIMFIGVLIAMITWTYAQGTGEIWGRVLDSKTGISIPGATVVVKIGDTPAGVFTDTDGYFRLKSLPPGYYNVEISFTGYSKGLIEKVYVYNEGITRTKEFSITAGVDLTEVVIHADDVVGLIIEPKIGPGELENMPDKTDLKKIISLTSADITRTDDGEMYFRGSREGDYVYYVDGIKTNAEHFKIPSTAIGSIQVYTGGVPARYGDFTGGCVVIETQSYTSWANSRY